MNRRDLLRMAAVGGVASIITSGCANKTSERSAHRGTSFEWQEASIADLQKAMESGRASAVSLTRDYLERIGKVDKAGPGINAIIEINPDAIGIAKSLDEERKAKGPRGPMHGIPVLVKDNIDTHDR